MTPFINQHFKMVGKKKPEIFTGGRGSFKEGHTPITCTKSFARTRFKVSFSACSTFVSTKRRKQRIIKKAHKTKCQ